MRRLIPTRVKMGKGDLEGGKRMGFKKRHCSMHVYSLAKMIVNYMLFKHVPVKKES